MTWGPRRLTIFFKECAVKEAVYGVVGIGDLDLGVGFKARLEVCWNYLGGPLGGCNGEGGESGHYSSNVYHVWRRNGGR